MADAYARMSGTVAAVTVHQGCGLTNAMTGIAEAAKSRTPLLVLAADVTEQPRTSTSTRTALADSVGAITMRVEAADERRGDAARAYHLARDDRRTVLLNLPLAVQAAKSPAEPTRMSQQPAGHRRHPTPRTGPARRRADPRAAPGIRRRPRRACRGAREALLELGEVCGALLATSAVAKGLFHGSPWSLDVSGGFASPLAAQLIGDADLIVGWGCALNMWTTRHGHLIGPQATVGQVDLDPAALGAHRAIRVRGHRRGHADRAAATAALAGCSGPVTGASFAERIAAAVRWRDVAYDDTSTASASIRGR